MDLKRKLREIYDDETLSHIRNKMFFDWEWEYYRLNIGYFKEYYCQKCNTHILLKLGEPELCLVCDGANFIYDRTINIRRLREEYFIKEITKLIIKEENYGEV